MSYQGDFACWEKFLVLSVFHSPFSVLGPTCLYSQNLLIVPFPFYYCCCWYYCYYCCCTDTCPYFFFSSASCFCSLLRCIPHFTANAFLKRRKPISLSSALLFILWHAPILCQPLHFRCCVLQLLLSAHSLHHFFSLASFSSSFSFSKTLHYTFPLHLWSLTHFILLFWTYRVELKWVRKWVLREIWIKSWSSVVPGIGARQMGLILLHTLQSRKMFEFVALPPYRVYH